MNTSGKKSGKGQWIAVLLIMVIGALLALLILTQTDRKAARQADDDDGPRPAAVQTPSPQKQEHDVPRVSMDEAQIEASGIDVATADVAQIASVVQFPEEVQLNDDRTVHVVPRVPGIAEAVLVSTGQTVRRGQTLAIFFLIILAALGICISALVIRQRVPLVKLFVRLVLRRVLFWTSGLFFSIIYIPEHLKPFLLWNPLLHGIELFRHALVPTYPIPGISLPYLLIWTFGSLGFSMFVYGNNEQLLVSEEVSQ